MWKTVKQERQANVLVSIAGVVILSVMASFVTCTVLLVHSCNEARDNPTVHWSSLDKWECDQKREEEREKEINSLKKEADDL